MVGDPPTTLISIGRILTDRKFRLVGHQPIDNRK